MHPFKTMMRKVWEVARRLCRSKLVARAPIRQAIEKFPGFRFTYCRNRASRHLEHRLRSTVSYRCGATAPYMPLARHLARAPDHERLARLCDCKPRKDTLGTRAPSAVALGRPMLTDNTGRGIGLVRVRCPAYPPRQVFNEPVGRVPAWRAWEQERELGT